ncbi:MAG: hypothetical protein HN929_11665, partial [Chloroflexi bacterium]|nr:hypothetical protein [Chloroflexota bacterium]
MEIINGDIKLHQGERIIDGVSIKGDNSHWWALDDTLAAKAGGITGTVTHVGTSRTRVNPDTGLIEAVPANVARFENVGGYDALLIEPAGTNLLTHSHEFDNAAWVETRSTISANAVIGPDGTLSADKLVEDGTASSTHYNSVVIAKEQFTDNATISFSTYLKQGEDTWAKIDSMNKASSFRGAWFNLGTGIIGTIGPGSTASITSASNGFYRCTINVDIGTGATDPTFYIYLAEANNDITIDGDGSSGIYIWGAQVEESPIPTSLIVTPGAEVLDDPGLTDAGEWDDSDANVTQDAGAGTVTWDGAGEGSFVSTDA